jgi:uncharacterized membrane protein YozB (DUF420 family)
MFPRGFLGTRADLLIDVIFVATLLTPVLLVWAIRLASQRKLKTHRLVQTSLLTVLLVAVLLFEVDLRMAGGSGSLMKGSPYAGTALLRTVLLSHVAANVVTFALWLVLVVRSWRKFEQTLPGSYTEPHRRTGRIVFAGTVFGAVSAIAMYVKIGRAHV